MVPEVLSVAYRCIGGVQQTSAWGGDDMHETIRGRLRLDGDQRVKSTQRYERSMRVAYLDGTQVRLDDKNADF